MCLVELLLQQLQQVGVKQIFGIPGDFVLPLFAAIEQAGTIPLYYLSHEPSAVFAADGASRISNQPAAVILTYGAGALNAVNAVAQAYVEQVPLLIIAGFPSQCEINRKLAIHHQAKHLDSQRDIYREITCAQVRLNDVGTAATELCRAVQTCKRESRPVLIEFPRDATDWQLPAAMVTQAFVAAKLFNAPAHQATPQQTVPQKTAPQQAVNHSQNTPYQQELALAVQAVRHRLKQAKQPVLLCGIGVRRFGAVAQVEQLASRLQVPMMTTLLGRACLDQQHPCYTGVFVDQHDQTQLKLLQESDLIILLGVIQNDSNFAAHPQLFPAEKVLVIGQGELKMPGVIYHDLPIAEVLNQLLHTELPEFSWSAAAKNIFDNQQIQSGNNLSRQFNSGSVVALLDQLLSAQSELVPLISDIGDCLFASLHAQPSALLAPAFYASMGYAVPAALGVQAASGLRPLVLVGDGAFQMTGLELGHCNRYGFSPIVVLLNNGGWQMIKAFSPNLLSTSLRGWNYSAIARGMNGSVHQVWGLEQLATAFSRALQETERFSLIEVMLPEGSSSCRLQQFADGFLNAQSA